MLPRTVRSAPVSQITDSNKIILELFYLINLFKLYILSSFILGLAECRSFGVSVGASNFISLLIVS